MLELAIHVNLTASPALEALLARLAALTAAPATPHVPAPPAPAPVVTAPVAVPVALPQPAPVAAPPVVPTAVPVAPAPGYQLDQLKAAGAELVSRPGGQAAQAMALLQKYGIRSMDELPSEQYGAFATDLRGLGANI